MRPQYLIPLLALLAGCAGNRSRVATLNADQAGSLAQHLANNKAETLYNCHPFSKVQPAHFVQGCWTWRQLQGLGQGDMEAKVQFRPDGSDPKVWVTRLESLPKPFPRLSPQGAADTPLLR